MKKNVAENIFRVECLRYTSDNQPGIRRVKNSTGLSFFGPDGKEITGGPELDRIQSLVIPPAWDDVWIAPSANSHLQATGRDAKGRKQYLYHPQWREYRSDSKFHRIIPFAESLPYIRRRTGEDLSLRGLPRAKVLATIVRLLEHTLIRIGNTEYAKANQSFGLSTLQDKHLVIAGRDMMFHFHGKSGKEHQIKVHDARLARIIKRLHELPGRELFQYYDDTGLHRVVDSEDVNNYLRDISGNDFTAKDFRTWGGTVIASVAFSEMGPFLNQSEAKRNVNSAIKKAAEKLGNRPATCSRYYVHPAVTHAYLEGKLFGSFEENPGSEGDSNDLRPEEKRVLKLIVEYDRAMEIENRKVPLCEKEAHG